LKLPGHGEKSTQVDQVTTLVIVCQALKQLDFWDREEGYTSCSIRNPHTRSDIWLEFEDTRTAPLESAPRHYIYR
jgi:hypothetical protein